MPLAKKKFLVLIIPIILFSTLSGCIFEDIFFGGTSFTLIDLNINDDDGFPSFSINFSCSGTVTIKILDTDSKLIDTDFFFKGRHNAILYLGEYRQTIIPGLYKLKVYDNDNKEIYSGVVTFKGSDISILSCSQKFWKSESSASSYSLFGLRMYVKNDGDIPVYPYDVQVSIETESINGLVLPCVIMPNESEYIECFIYKESIQDDSLFTLSLRDIDENILASKSFTVEVTDNVPTKLFTWNYYGPHLQRIPESEYLYDYHSGLERINNEDYSLYIFDTYDDEYIDIIVDKIMFGFDGTNAQKVNYMAAFVQNIDYRSDSETDSSYEYPRYPVETLFDGRGDCEDKAILTASLLYSMGYDVALLRLPNHMAVGVNLSKDEIPNFDYYIDNYYFLETTTKGKSCGFIPYEYIGSNSTVTVYPLSNRPLLMHNWKDGTIIIYTNSEMDDFVKVTAIVKNHGLSTVKNIRIEGAFFSLDGAKINYETTTISGLESNMKKKVTLSINIPKSLTTLFKTRIYLDDVLVDEKESISTFP